MNETDRDAAARLRLALDMFATGEGMRQNLRRRWPDASPQEIEAKLGAWLEERPGAEHGDADGRLGRVALATPAAVNRIEAALRGAADALERLTGSRA